MFIRYYVEVPLPQAQAEDAVLRLAPDVLQGLVDAAYMRGESLWADEVPARATTANGHHNRVSVERFGPVNLSGKTVLPMSWRIEPPGVLPSMEVDLEVAPLGRDQSQLALSARYGREPDGTRQPLEHGALHRVTEAVVKDVLDRLRSRLG